LRCHTHVTDSRFRLSLSLRIAQNSRLWAKEWAKGFVAARAKAPAVRSRGGQRLPFGGG